MVPRVRREKIAVKAVERELPFVKGAERVPGNLNALLFF
jgi:hypothetical protein